MALFERKTAAKKAPAKKATDKKKTEVVKAEAPKTLASLNAPHVLTSPHVSEKAARLAANSNTYVFDVPLHAGKVEVRKAVEAIYGVNVLRVNISRGKGKVVRRGRTTGVRSDWKKAHVTLKTGQKLDLYEGV